MKYKPLPVGVDDFENLISKNYYFVDKTNFIKELLDKKGEVNLFTRPRRFGKTLLLSMLRYFFEDERDIHGARVDRAGLFEGLDIMQAGAEYLLHMGQFPVINLTLMSAKQPDFDMAYSRLCECIVMEYQRHRYVLEGDGLLEADKKLYETIMNRKAGKDIMATSLEFLSRCLYACHGKKTIILIDEYDVPLENAFFQNFYEEMAGFLRSLFASALKSNLSLEFSVITGCLRISKESIFTGMNNFKIRSVLNDQYAEYFGFTEENMQQMCRYYHLESKTDVIRDWYNGYVFGNTRVYNPWSMIQFIDDLLANMNKLPVSYWGNTSSNSIVKSLVEYADAHTRNEIEELLAGGTIEKPVNEDITYADIYDNMDNIWNFLFFTGYLKKLGERQQGEEIYLKLGIPNKEIRAIYRNTILKWFDAKLKKQDFSALRTAIETGDCKTFGEFVSSQLLDTISFFDYGEKYYHGFLAGLLKGMGGYEVLSNRESGTGRPDLVLKELKFCGKSVVIEIKVTDSFSQMEVLCEDALSQIANHGYGMELTKDGYQAPLEYGVCFFKKGCMVKLGMAPK